MSFFRPLVVKRAPIHKSLLALDIENNPKTGKFINANLYGYVSDHHGKEHLIDEYFTEQDKLCDYLDGLETGKNIPCKLIFFNLSYDYWFLSSITNDDRMLSNGTRIITGELRNGIPLVDLTNHVDGSLEDWIGYLNLKEKGIRKETFEDIEKRVRNDTRATYELGCFLQSYYIDTLKIPFKLTIASSARYLFALHYFTEYWFRPESRIWMNDYEREGYKGGRCEIFKRGLIKVKSYDENSEYLSVMRDNPLPNPNTAEYRKTGFNIDMDKLFIADVTVRIPKQRVAPLPYNNGKLIFPTGGVFTGKWYSPELVYAVKQCGVEIVKVHSYITYDSSLSFRKYADFIWERRKEAKGNPGMDKLIKKLGNALYGGFGQRNKIWTFYGKLKDFMGVVGEDSDIVPRTIDGEDYITTGSSEKEDSNHTFPCIPGFITSYARKDLLISLKENEKNVVYCDTDSIKIEVTSTSKKQHNTGDELGQWGFEYEKWQWFYKPKMYGDANIDDKEHSILINEPMMTNKNGKRERAFKIKGIPSRADLVYESSDERTYVYRKPNRMRESFKRGMMPNKWEYIVKVVNLLDDKREWVGLDSVPIHIEQTESEEKEWKVKTFRGI